MLSVRSTALTAHLSPVREGTGMGMLHATSAIAGVMGVMVGGCSWYTRDIIRSWGWQWRAWRSAWP